MIDKRARPTKLLWVDLEMTGLQPTKDVILEVAAIVTDFDFRTLASYQAVIAQPEDKLECADIGAKELHVASGLLERVRDQGKPESDVVVELAALIREHFGAEPAVLAGNSIHQDRQFIRQWWPEVEALLHYRMLDVTSLKVYFQGKYGVEFQKADTHRAQDDIQASIDEWKHYINLLSDPEQLEARS